MLELQVNGKTVRVDVPPDTRLVYVLRNDLATALGVPQNLVRVIEQCSAGCAANGNIPGLMYRSQTTDLFSDPHLKERGFLHKVPHEALGEVPLLGFPPRLSESQVPIKAAPLLGKSYVIYGVKDVDRAHASGSVA